jgi:hypothetical protein
MMIVIVVVAGLLVTLRLGAFAVLLPPYFALCAPIVYGVCRSARDYKRLPRVAFAVMGVLINAFCFVASITWSPLVFIFVIPFPCLIGSAVTCGFGAAWCAAARHHPANGALSRALRFAFVAAVSILPTTMLFTQWPFKLAFAASRPALERLADQVAAGVRVSKPVPAGAFRIVASAVDPATGGVALITDPNPNGRSGFERRGPGTPGGGPFFNLRFDMQLSAKWWYLEED